VSTKRAAAPPAARTAASLRGLPAALTAAAMAFITAKFAMGAHDTLTRTRDGACIALDPTEVPAFLKDGHPDFQLPDVNGKMTSLKEQLGHPVLLNFWATWCPPCVDEVPALEDLARRLDGTDMRMLAVSVDDDWDKIRQFFAKGTKMGILLDTSHDIPKKFGTTAYPETFMVDSAGRIRYYFINKRDWSRPEAVACLESLR
jgi:cytochrome c biogenesis protein CcmG/thiol:disulfide interchange protein DsbE